MSTRNERIYPALAMIACAVVALPAVVPATAACPDGMTRVDDAFCIDRYEGSLMETLPDGSERAWSPYHCPEHVRVRAVSRRNVVPQGYISARQAETACRA